MVDGPDLRVPNLSPVRPPGVGGVSGVSNGVPAKGEAGAPTGEARAPETPVARTGFDSLELTNRSSISEMPVSILSDAILTRSEWGWRRFLSDFAAQVRTAPSSTGNAATTENAATTGNFATTGNAATEDRTNLSLVQALNQIRAMQQRELGAQSGATSAQDEATGAEGGATGAQSGATGAQGEATGTQGEATGAGQSPSGTELPSAQQPQPGPSGTEQISRMMEGVGPQKIDTPDFARIVVTMRQVIDHVARLPEQQTWQVNWPRSVDNPQLLPFAKVHDANIPSAVLHPLREWTLSDRLNTAVQDAGGPMFGGGLCFVPSPIQDSSHAVRWRAHRSTFVQEDGKKVHRLVVDIQVRDRPARVTIVSMAPHLAVHLETNDKRLRKTVPPAEQDLSNALVKSGFILQSLSVGDYRGQGQGGLSDEP